MSDRAWEYARGIVKVDGLEPSPEMLKLIEREERGEISLSDIRNLLNKKYACKEVVV